MDTPDEVTKPRLKDENGDLCTRVRIGKWPGDHEWCMDCYPGDNTIDPVAAPKARYISMTDLKEGMEVVLADGSPGKATPHDYRLETSVDAEGRLSVAYDAPPDPVRKDYTEAQLVRWMERGCPSYLSNEDDIARPLTTNVRVAVDALKRGLAALDGIQKDGMIWRRVPPAVHILHYGRPLCGFSTAVPGDWPKGHKWVAVTNVADVTCDRCDEEWDGMK